MSSPSKIFGGRVSPYSRRRPAAAAGWAGLDGGDEVCAGFADRLEVAVEFRRNGAVAAEHALVHLLAELGHLGSPGVGGQRA
jgi:hypothetical protein